MQKITVIFLSTSVALGAMLQGALAEDADNITAAYSKDGRYYTADDVPTFNVAEDGTVDWPTYEGFRRYHSECHVCHGPDGEGSSYAPAIKNSAVDLDYYDFLEIVASGKMESKGGTEFVMPTFGANRNVMCYLDDIYVYLKARGSDAIPRGRPRQKEPKSDAIRADQKECLDG